MNFDGIKLTINFENNQDKENFYKFVKNYLGIEETYGKFNDGQFPKNKKNLKFKSFRLHTICYKSINKKSFKQYSFCDINIKTLGPIILTMKETNNEYITLNFKNISGQVKLDESFLSQEEIDFFHEYYTNAKELTKRKFIILDKVFEYIFNNNLHSDTKIKEVNFSHYDFSEDKYKIFNETKRKFVISDFTLDIKKYYFDYPVVYSDKYEEYLKIYSSLISYETNNITVEEYDSYDRIRFTTTNKNIKSLEIGNNKYYFEPLIDKESSYIQINKFLEEKIKFKNKRLNNPISFSIKPYQLVKVRVSGWFTQNKAILLSKNESTKYYYRLSDSIEEINQHINQFLKKYTLYKIQNNQIESEIIDDEEPFFHRESEYDYITEDTSSKSMPIDESDDDFEFDEKKLDKKLLEIAKKLKPNELINSDSNIKLSKPILKKFEKYEDVEKINFFNSLRFLSNMISKYKR